MTFTSKFMLNIGRTHSFHNFHGFWNYGLRRFGGFNTQKLMGNIGFTNSFHEFGIKNHGNYW